MRGSLTRGRGVIVALAAMILPATAPAAAQATRLVVEVAGVEEGQGRVRIALCQRSLDEQGCTRGAQRAAVLGVERFVFEGLAPGGWAVAAYQDLDDDGRLDTMPPGLPLEPYAFSNDVGRLAPPSFEKARFIVERGETVIELRLRRLLGS